jgi:hypothetical protein
MITIDCSGLLSDFATRLSAGETLAELMPDLLYGILAELEEVLDQLLTHLLMQEVKMNNVIGRNNSPEPANLLPPRNRGLFYCINV